MLNYQHIGSYNIKWTVPIEFEDSSYSMHHFFWLDENNVLCSLSTTSQSFLCVLTLDRVNDETQGQITVG